MAKKGNLIDQPSEDIIDLAGDRIAGEDFVDVQKSRRFALPSFSGGGLSIFTSLPVLLIGMLVSLMFLVGFLVLNAQKTEKESKYIIWHMWGLMVESTNAMTRMVFSGVMEKFPKLKIIIHHCGAMVPYFSERITNHYNQSEMRNKTNFTVGLTEMPADYFRRFYTDTALIGNTPALMCAYAFYGPEKMLFGTDSPFDAQIGDYGTKRTIRAVEEMQIPEKDKHMIFEGNARKLLRLPV